MKLSTSAIILVMLATLASCSGKGDENTVKVQKPPVAVETATASYQPLIDGIDVTGNLEPKFYADVKTQIPGLVKQVLVTEWVRVRKGQPLAMIDLAETEAMVKRAKGFDMNIIYYNPTRYENLEKK